MRFLVCKRCDVRVKRTGHRQKYCISCSEQVKRERLQSNLKPKIEKECAICGNSFLAPRKNSRTCSPECSRQSDLERYRKREERNRGGAPAYRTTTRECQRCGETFRPFKSSQLCCSRKCYKAEWWQGNSPSAPKEPFTDSMAIEGMVRMYSAALESGEGVNDRELVEGSLERWVNLRDGKPYEPPQWTSFRWLAEMRTP